MRLQKPTNQNRQTEYCYNNTLLSETMHNSHLNPLQYATIDQSLSKHPASTLWPPMRWIYERKEFPVKKIIQMTTFPQNITYQKTYNPKQIQKWVAKYDLYERHHIETVNSKSTGLWRRNCTITFEKTQKNNTQIKNNKHIMISYITWLYKISSSLFLKVYSRYNVMNMHSIVSEFHDNLSLVVKYTIQFSLSCCIRSTQ